MFHLFGKKKETGEKALSPEEAQVQAFAQQFDPEEFTILAVTGANGFGGEKAEEGDPLWTASIGLTAWMEEDGEEVYQEEAQLVTLADDKLLEYLRGRVPRDFIIKVKVREALEGERFQMLGTPEPGFDPDLKAILDQQKKPVSHYIEGLGTFTLNRSIQWFEASVDWLGREIALDFDQKDDLSACAQAAKALMEHAQDWDARVRACAAKELVSLANDWAQDGAQEGEDVEEVTQEQFVERMELDSIQVKEDGSFEFWFSDGDLLWGHAIRVSGDLEHGPTGAQMEG